MFNKMKERIPFIDWLRAVACFLVMLVHAAENFYGVVTEKAIESIPGGAEKLAGFATNTGGMAGDKAVCAGNGACRTVSCLHRLSWVPEGRLIPP